jgi:hypothetical protein
LHAFGAAVDAVRENKDAVQIIALDAPYDTLSELAARLDILGRLHDGRDGDLASSLTRLLDELPLDAPDDLQQSAALAFARTTTAADSEPLLKRIRRKKALGFEASAEFGAFGPIFRNASDPWTLQRTLLGVELTPAEQDAYVRACDHNPSSELVSALANMLDPRNYELRRLAADLLMRIDTKAAAAVLKSQLASEPDLAYKLQLATFAGRHGFDDGYAYAIEHMSDPRYVDTAAEALAAINKAGSTQHVLGIYQTSNDLDWKRAAIRALGLLGHNAFQSELGNLTRDLSHPLAPAALLARADLDDISVMQLLPAALSARSEAVTVAAARSSGKLLATEPGRASPAASEIREGLATLAADPQAQIDARGYALEALLVGEDPHVDDVLIAMIRDVGIERTKLLLRVRELLRERKVRILP